MSRGLIGNRDLVICRCAYLMLGKRLDDGSFGTRVRVDVLYNSWFDNGLGIVGCS